MTTNYEVAVDAARSGKTAVAGKFKSKWGQTSSRVYFFDATTGEELYAAVNNGNLESGIYQGSRYVDTVLAVDVVDLTTGLSGFICADAFPGRRVVVKFWYPEGHSCPARVAALVDRAKGWQGNEVATGNEARVELGIGRKFLKAGQKVDTCG